MVEPESISKPIDYLNTASEPESKNLSKNIFDRTKISDAQSTFNTHLITRSKLNRAITKRDAGTGSEPSLQVAFELGRYALHKSEHVIFLAKEAISRFL